jgi:hypothetical protein
MAGNVQNDNNRFMMIEQARSDTERASQATQLARDLMEQLNPINVLNGIAEVLLKVLGAVSG